MITASIVSHGQGELVEHLLAGLVGCPEVSSILLTLNIPEPAIRIPDALADRVVLLHNQEPRGFGTNHNQAFQRVVTPCFCILNPDILIPANPFPELLKPLASGSHALSAPMIINRNGDIEDSARRLPSPWGILGKVLGRSDGRYVFAPGDEAFSPDWVGGMFMLVKSDAYAAVGGFDERFFLYYEDVDLCCRMRLAGFSLLLCPQVSAIHDARRASHRSLRFLRWHLSSILRFFGSGVFWRSWWRLQRRLQGRPQGWR